MKRPAKRSGGAAGLFVLIGILAILAVTFAAGTYAGRIWATRPRMVATVAPTEREPARRGAEPRASRVPEPAPRLTFYHELTAPLTAPPPPPKPAKTPPPPLVTTTASVAKPVLPERAATADALSAHDSSATSSNTPSTTQAALAIPATTSSRFTVQVAAYRYRAPADALRATLAAAGHDARVVESDAPNGVRFRVQIGDFASRDAARDAASRFNGPTFVTTR